MKGHVFGPSKNLYVPFKKKNFRSNEQDYWIFMTDLVQTSIEKRGNWSSPSLIASWDSLNPYTSACFQSEGDEPSLADVGRYH